MNVRSNHRTKTVTVEMGYAEAIEFGEFWESCCPLGDQAWREMRAIADAGHALAPHLEGDAR